MEKIFSVLLLFVPLTITAEYFHTSPFLIFFLAALAIVPLARLIGEATEELSTYTGTAFGGFLNATFGNITEFLISVFALRAGLTEVVKASITGSIIGNILLVAGAAMLAGGWKYKTQTFNRVGTLASSSTLLLAAIGLIMPAIFLQTSSDVSLAATTSLNVVVSVCMLAIYVAYVVFTLHTHKHLYIEEVGLTQPNWSKKKSITILALSTLFVAWMSEILVGAIEPVVEKFGWSELFIGVIFIAIIGNAAEHASAITVAMKNRMDLALQIAIGSATQIALFIAPLLVLLSFALGTPMDLIFNPFELIAIVLSIVIANFVVQDGESNWLEGVQLLAAYAIMAAAFFFHP